MLHAKFTEDYDPEERLGSIYLVVMIVVST